MGETGMTYHLEINGEAVALSVAPAEDGQLTITTTDHAYRVDCRRIDRHQLFLTVDGVNVNAFVSGGADAKEILINGTFYSVADADARVLSTASGGASRELPREVTPPMPSVVVKVLVTEGLRVYKGDNLVVVSAMKMETTLTAPFDALVAGINAAEGDKVMPGDILIDLAAVDGDGTDPEDQ
jgi:acetyl/propionyl-CoA carboxylase alpha subunit